MAISKLDAKAFIMDFLMIETCCLHISCLPGQSLHRCISNLEAILLTNIEPARLPIQLGFCIATHWLGGCKVWDETRKCCCMAVQRSGENGSDSQCLQPDLQTALPLGQTPQFLFKSWWIKASAEGLNIEHLKSTCMVAKEPYPQPWVQNINK